MSADACFQGEKHVRVTLAYEPSEHEQNFRCGHYVGIYISSEDLSSRLPQEKDLSSLDLVRCESLRSERLSKQVSSAAEVRVHNVLRSEDTRLYLWKHGWVQRDEVHPLAEFPVPGVIDDIGEPMFGNVSYDYILLHDSTPTTLGAFASEGVSIESEIDFQVDLQGGGPFRAFVTGLQKELCDQSSTAACSFLDKPVTQAIESAFVVTQTHFETPSPIDFDTSPGQKHLAFRSISTWKSCQEEDARQMFNLNVRSGNALRDLEEDLGGVFMTRGENERHLEDAVDVPTKLISKAGKMYSDLGCDFVWWEISKLCHPAGNGSVRASSTKESDNGFVRVNPDTGKLEHHCGVSPGEDWIGPASAVFINIIFTNLGTGWAKEQKKAAGILAARAGFIPVPRSSASIFTGGWKGKYWGSFAGERKIRTQAYVQLDPRIQSYRDSTCN